MRIYFFPKLEKLNNRIQFKQKQNKFEKLKSFEQKCDILPFQRNPRVRSPLYGCHRVHQKYSFL